MTDAQNLGERIVILVVSPFIVLFLILIAVMVRAVRKATTSRRWPSTDGRILQSGIRRHVSLNPSGTHSTIYEPDILYEYAAEGRNCRSKQISFGAIDGSSAEAWAQSLADRYPEGSAVRVFYNPAKPDDAILEHAGPGCNAGLLVLFLVIELGLIALVVGGLTGHLS